MASVTQRAYSTILAGLSTELNSLANNTMSALGPALGADGSAQDLMGDVELVVTYGTAPTAGSVVDVYAVPAVDGTNYADTPTATTGKGLLIATFEPG